MANIKFDDFLREQLKDPKFKASFEEEDNKLSSSAAILLAREDMGWTQAELAEHANVPRSTVSRTEKGNNVSIATLTKLAAAMGKSVKIKID